MQTETFCRACDRTLIALGWNIHAPIGLRPDETTEEYGRTTAVFGDLPSSLTRLTSWTGLDNPVIRAAPIARHSRLALPRERRRWVRKYSVVLCHSESQWRSTAVSGRRRWRPHFAKVLISDASILPSLRRPEGAVGSSLLFPTAIRSCTKKLIEFSWLTHPPLQLAIY